MYDINTVTAFDLVADAIEALNTARGMATGSPMAQAKFLEARALADVAQAAAAQGRYYNLEHPEPAVGYVEGFIDGADSEVDLIINEDGTTEAGITPEEAGVRQAEEEREADGFDDDFGRTADDVFGDALAEAKANDKKKSKKGKSE